MPNCICCNFLYILAIPSAVSEQHQQTLSARKSQAAAKIWGSRQSGLGAWNLGKGGGEKSLFLLLEAKWQINTEEKGNTPLQILGHSGSAVHWRIIAFYCRVLLNSRRLFKHQCQILCNLLSNKLLKEYRAHHISWLAQFAHWLCTCLLSNFTVRVHQAAFIPSLHRAGLFLFCIWKAAPFQCMCSYPLAAFKHIHLWGFQYTISQQSCLRF